MTQKNAPEHGPSGPVSPSTPLEGEIIGLEETRIRVRLQSGAIGFLAKSGEETLSSAIQLGQHGLFQILRCDENGETLLTLHSLQDSEAPHSFEHDVDRLQVALNHHHTAPVAREEPLPTMDEQRIQQWLNRADKSLEKLRKNRAKRLNEEFYSGT